MARFVFGRETYPGVLLAIPYICPWIILTALQRILVFHTELSSTRFISTLCIIDFCKVQKKPPSWLFLLNFSLLLRSLPWRLVPKRCSLFVVPYLQNANEWFKKGSYFSMNKLFVSVCFCDLSFHLLLRTLWYFTKSSELYFVDAIWTISRKSNV